LKYNCIIYILKKTRVKSRAKKKHWGVGFLPDSNPCWAPPHNCPNPSKTHLPVRAFTLHIIFPYIFGVCTCSATIVFPSLPTALLFIYLFIYLILLFYFLIFSPCHVLHPCHTCPKVSGVACYVLARTHLIFFFFFFHLGMTCLGMPRPEKKWGKGQAEEKNCSSTFV
jgi:hypothetical protein